MKQILFIIVLFFNISVFSQEKNKDSLKIELSKIKTEIKQLEKKASFVQSEINKQYGWKFWNFGIVGFNLSSSNNWYSKKKPNLSSSNIRIVQDIYLTLNKEKYFWVNYTNINLSWKKSYDRDENTENKGFENESDVFKFTSLFGYKLSKKLAISVLSEYDGTFIKDFGNSPSFLDYGIGMAWKPLENAYVIVHPLNYQNIIFGKNTYHSSFGTKLEMDFAGSIKKVKLKTNLSAFFSYQSVNYSNWTWTNSFGYSFWKGLGIGFNFGLRQNKQEEFNSKLTSYPNLKSAENKLQSFWSLGLSYSL